MLWTVLFIAARAFAADQLPQKIEIPKAPPKAAAEMSEAQKTIYALGAFIGRNVERSVAPFNLSASELKTFMKGLQDTLAKRPMPFDVSSYGPKLQELQAARAGAKAEGEKKKSKAFLEKAAKEKGAQVFPSGLIYFEEKAGDGPSPAATDTIKAHYRGTLVDGTEFDSSYKRGQPLEFSLSGVIKCWTEGIPKMKVGGKAKLICPSAIGYGDQGAGAGIPGGATLIFEVELVSISGK